MKTEIEKIKLAYKGRLFDPVFLTLMCMGPIGHLILNLVDKNYDQLLRTIFFSIISFGIIVFMWVRYYLHHKKYKKELKKYLSNPEEYEW